MVTHKNTFFDEILISLLSNREKLKRDLKAQNFIIKNFIESKLIQGVDFDGFLKYYEILLSLKEDEHEDY